MLDDILRDEIELMQKYFFQPDINSYASEIMPLLFNVLHQMQDEKRGSGLTKAYYALENFVENLGKFILWLIARY